MWNDKGYALHDITAHLSLRFRKAKIIWLFWRGHYINPLFGGLASFRWLRRWHFSGNQKNNISLKRKLADTREKVTRLCNGSFWNYRTSKRVEDTLWRMLVITYSIWTFTSDHFLLPLSIRLSCIRKLKETHSKFPGYALTCIMYIT